MIKESLPAEDHLLGLFGRLRRVAFGQHPLQDSGITMPQLTLLERVEASPGCGIQAIADGLGLTAATVSVGVRRLEKAGLLERSPTRRMDAPSNSSRPRRVRRCVSGRSLFAATRWRVCSRD